MTDQVDAVVETVEVTGQRLGLAVGAFFVGAGIGGGLAYIFAKRHFQVKYSKIADEEIAEMREHYQAKARAAEGKAQKGDVEALSQGYSSPEPPPMAVQPPITVVEDGDEDDPELVDEDNVPSPDTILDEVAEVNRVPDTSPEARNIFREQLREKLETSVDDTWDYQEELKLRSPDIPYVIHTDERDEMEGYGHVTLHYYDGDDVLCNEQDDIIDPDYERDRLVGERNLTLFGHGSNDRDIVYIRNDKLEIVFEVCKSNNSFAEEVHGFSHEGYYRGNLERMRAKEHDDPEE